MNLDTPTPPPVARIVALSAAYDLVVTAPFATPWTARLVADLLASAHLALHLPGAPPTLDGAVPLLFACLMGSLVVVWSIVRLRAPVMLLGAADTAARALFSAWMAYALWHGASPVVAGFIVPEIGWGLWQGRAVLKAAASPADPGATMAA